MYADGEDRAMHICSLLTADALRQNGYAVTTYELGEGAHFTNFRAVLHLSRDFDILHIIIDGRGSLDKFTLIKLFHPHIKIIWEIHGVIGECFWLIKNRDIQFAVIKKKLKRKLLATLVDGSVCLTEELLRYSRESLKINRGLVVPSFYSIRKDKDHHKLTVKSKFIISSLQKDQNIHVLWGGGANLPWQAIDVIEEVAKRTYLFNKHILFILVGSDRWHNFHFTENVLFYESMPHWEYTHIMRDADICLALYHSTDSLSVTGSGFYFSPRKIVECMAYKKPVIATDSYSTRKFIQDKVNGFLTTNDINQITNIILSLARNFSERRRVGNAAANTIRNYNLESAAARYQAAYNIILG